MARSLEKLIEYEGEDLADVFQLDWPRGSELNRQNRHEHVEAYVRWFFNERCGPHMSLICQGFASVVVGSELLRRGHVGPWQLEQFLCGLQQPVDVAALRAGAEINWPSDDGDYIDSFWQLLTSLPDSERLAFVVFVSACGRAPMRGWGGLRLKIQRNGSADSLLPTAFTCFNLLLLPRYSSTDILRARLCHAITETEGFGLS